MVPWDGVAKWKHKDVGTFVMIKAGEFKGYYGTISAVTRNLKTMAQRFEENEQKTPQSEFDYQIKLDTGRLSGIQTVTVNSSHCLLNVKPLLVPRKLTPEPSLESIPEWLASESSAQLEQVVRSGCEGFVSNTILMLMYQ